MASKVNVMVSGAGTAPCQSVIKALRSQTDYEVNITVLGANDNNASRFFADFFAVTPSPDSNDYLDCIEKICSSHEIKLFIPLVPEELPILATARENLKCEMLLPVLDVLEGCIDRWKGTHLLKQTSVSVAATWLPDQLDLNMVHFPLWVRPRRLSSGRNDFHRVTSRMELAGLIDSYSEPLVQTLADGNEYAVDMLCDQDGKAVNGIVRLKIQQQAGYYFKWETVECPEILAQAKHVAESICIPGPSVLRCFQGQNKKVLFFEIEPRPTGNLELAVAAGFNIPRLMLDLVDKGKARTSFGAYDSGVRMYRYWQEVFVNPKGKIIVSPHLGPLSGEDDQAA